MQFTTIVATAFALAASVSAATPSYPIGNGTVPAGTAAPSGTGSSSPSSSATFVPNSGASTLSTGAMGLLVVGGIALAL